MRLLRLIRHFNTAIVVIFFISTLLVSIWFKSGNIMGVAESGLAFYNFGILYNLIKDSWEGYTLGFPNNIGVASIPMYWFFATLQIIGIPSFIIQMFFFWIVLVISGLGIYLLAKELFPKLENRFLMITVLFYWFNPFAMLNIWNRFLTNFLLAYAFIPMVLYFFIRGIHTRKYRFAILIGLLSFVFSHAETAMTFNIIFWSILLYTTIFYVFLSKKWKNRFFIFKFFTLTLFFWTLVNLWWIGQIFSYIFLGNFNTVVSSTFTTFGNYQTFSILSKTLGNLVDLIRLRHDNSFNSLDLSWIRILDFPLFTVFNFLIVGIVLTPLIFIENRAVFFLGGLFLIGIFLAKGNNPPFGEINDRLFLSSSLMQLFRNPFEKFGFLLVLSSTLLFTYGLYFLIGFFKNRYSKIFYGLILGGIILIWGMPFWTGYVFVGFEEPTSKPNTGYQVIVPDYYKDAYKWLASQKEDFRILVLPLGGEGITYTWDKGYSGVELTNQLLPKSAISFNTNFPFYDGISKNIEKLFITTTYFPFLANALNIKYIMLRQDVDWELRKMKNPKTELSILEEKEQKGELKKVAQFGQLTFWEVMFRTKAKIYTSSSALLNYSQPQISDLEFSRNNLVINSGDKMNNISSDKIEGELIHPGAQFYLDHEVEPVFEIRQDMFPYVSILPTNWKYPVVLIKDRIEENAIKDQQKLLDYRLATLGKRLVELKFSEDLNYEKGIVIATKEYRKLLIRTFSLIEESEKSDFVNKQAALQAQLYLLLSRHIKVLKEAVNKSNLKSETRLVVESALKMLKKYMLEAYIYPTNDFLINDNFPIKRRLLYSLEVKNSGDYELLWDKKILNGFYVLSINDPLTLQIDNKFLIKNIEDDYKGYVSLGKMYFTKGIHEIGLNLPEALNLINDSETINFKVDHGSKVNLFPIKNYDSYSSYSIDFNYWIKKGNGVQILVYDKKPEDITPSTKPSESFVVGPDLYDYTAKNFSRGFKLPSGADNATVAIVASSWNNCETIFYSNQRERCISQFFRSRYDKTTEVDVSNIHIRRDFSDQPMLIREDLVEFEPPPELEFQKQDGTTYLVKIKNAKRPFFLIFSELFDQGWVISDSKGDLLNSQHFLANNYANSWYIDKTGNFQIIIKYTPQSLLIYGEKISALAVLLGTIAVLLVIRKGENEKNN